MPRTSDEKERLHKRIAASGLCSRRAAEEMIAHARVQVNGQLVTEMGVKVGPKDEIKVDGKVISGARVFTLVMNKPAGYLTTLSDPHHRQTVLQLLPDLGVQIKPVGRLDMDTEGLLLFTNDGELAHRLTHPRYGVEKEYQAVVTGIPDEQGIQKLRDGIYIEEGGKTAPARVELAHADRKKGNAVLRIAIHEGRKRQVRLMCEAIGHPVQTLRRIRFGTLVLKNLAPGECRMLGQKEVGQLKAQVGLTASSAPKGTVAKPGSPRQGAAKAQPAGSKMDQVKRTNRKARARATDDSTRRSPEGKGRRKARE